MSVDGHVVLRLADMGFEEDVCSPDNQATDVVVSPHLATQ